MGDICLGMEVGRAADIDCPGIERDLHLCLALSPYVLSLLWPSFCSHRLLPLSLSPAPPAPILAWLVLAAAVWEGNGCPVVKRSEG